MTKTGDEVACATLEASIKALEKNYDEITRIYLALDSKAQMCAAVSGVLIPVTIGLVRWNPTPATPKGPHWPIVVLVLLGGVTVVSAIRAVRAAVKAMKPKMYPLPYDENALVKEAGDIVAAAGTATLGHHVTFLDGRMGALQAIVKHAHGSRERKAAMVESAQDATWRALGALLACFTVYLVMVWSFPEIFLKAP